MPSLSPMTGNLTRAQAAHLLRRATFGPTRQEINDLTGMSADAAVDLLFQAQPAPAAPLHPQTGVPFTDREEFDMEDPGQALIAYVRSWWLKQMIQADKSALEKMTFFLHTHFTMDAVKVNRAFAIYQMNALMRQFAFGDFKALAKKIITDYAMSVFLDGWTNNVNNPNENFAREYLELFTIGKGQQIGDGNYTTYTEDDVQAAARLLTGFIPSGFLPDNQVPPTIPIMTDPETGLYTATPVPVFHDIGAKNFSEAFQNQTITLGSFDTAGMQAELDDFVDMIFNQDATAEFLVRKLYRFFVYYEITEEIENDIIQPLAATFRNNNYNLETVVKQLLKSEHFYDVDNSPDEEKNIGGLVKSPIELIVGVARYFQVPLPDESTSSLDHYGTLLLYDLFSRQTEMELFQVPEVAGWPAYHQEPAYNRNWVNSTTLVNRFSGMEFLVRGVPVNDDTYNVRLDAVDFLENGPSVSNAFDPNAVVGDLVEDLFPFNADLTKIEVLKDLLLDGDVDAYWSTEWANYINSGMDSVVRIRLEALFDAILQSPEFQLS
ncbi:MAG: DUF1800 family protein [Bacteroidota bacterium]